MNLSIKKLSVVIPMLLFSGLYAVTVTLSVDLSTQASISDSGVHVAGNFGDYDYDDTFENPDYPNWDPAGIELYDNDGDSIYSIELQMAAGTIQYKFINGNNWGPNEFADGTSGLPCQADGSDNRELIIPDSDSLDVGTVCWESCISCDEVYVTFRVDMEYEDVSDAGVHVAGNFQGWDPSTTMLEIDSVTGVYTMTTALGMGEELQFKFVNGNEWSGAESVPDDCAAGGNRFFTVPDFDTTTVAICFAACDACAGAPDTATVTFQADMSDLLNYGFDPTVHTLELRGAMNGWSGGDVFEEDLLDPELYSIDVTFSAYVGDAVEWKFKANPDENWNNNGWESGSNHMIDWTGEDQVLDPLLPNILPTGELQNEVNMNVVIEWHEGTLNSNTGEAFPVAPDTIIMNGSFLNGWYTWGDCMGPDCATPVGEGVPKLTDEDGDGVYTGTVILPAGHSNVFTFKFGAFYPGVDSLASVSDNGAMDNEAGFGADYVAYIPSEQSTDYELMGAFGDNNPDNPWLSIIGDKPIIANEFSLMGNYPNPFNPSTSIMFNLDAASHINVRIFNLMGEEVRILQNNSLEAGFHSVTWNARNNFGKEVPSGMYFYSIESNGKILSGKMLLLK